MHVLRDHISKSLCSNLTLVLLRKHLTLPLVSEHNADLAHLHTLVHTHTYRTLLLVILLLVTLMSHGQIALRQFKPEPL
jgi:hypothetical protein